MYKLLLQCGVIAKSKYYILHIQVCLVKTLFLVGFGKLKQLRLMYKLTTVQCGIRISYKSLWL